MQTTPAVASSAAYSAIRSIGQRVYPAPAQRAAPPNGAGSSPPLRLSDVTRLGMTLRCAAERLAESQQALVTEAMVGRPRLATAAAPPRNSSSV